MGQLEAHVSGLERQLGEMRRVGGLRGRIAGSRDQVGQRGVRHL